MRWAFLALVVIGSLFMIFIVATPQGKAGFRAALFVPEVLDVPLKPQPWFTGDPVRHEVSYPQAAGTGVADVYRIPYGKRRAAVLLFLGANAAGRDDEDVVNLGEALARGGFVVDASWDNGKITAAKITANPEGKLTVRYNGKSVEKNLQAGESLQVK